MYTNSCPIHTQTHTHICHIRKMHRPNKKNEMKKWKILSIICATITITHKHPTIPYGWSESKMKNNKNERAQGKKADDGKMITSKGQFTSISTVIHYTTCICERKTSRVTKRLPNTTLSSTRTHRAQSSERKRKRPNKKNVRSTKNEWLEKGEKVTRNACHICRLLHSVRYIFVFILLIHIFRGIYFPIKKYSNLSFVIELNIGFRIYHLRRVNNNPRQIK